MKIQFENENKQLFRSWTEKSIKICENWEMGLTDPPRKRKINECQTVAVSVSDNK